MVLSGTKNQLRIDNTIPDINPLHFPHSIIITQMHEVAISNDASFADGSIEDIYKNTNEIAINIEEIVMFLDFFIVFLNNTI